MTNTIKISRGVKANMPVLANGQQYFCTDTKEVYIGNKGVNDNIPIVIEKINQIEATYAQLTALIQDDALRPGYQYVLTDYITKYQQPVTLTLKTADKPERLVLTAISHNAFDIQCSSIDYPQDIIWYDFNDVLCEDGTTPRNGFIMRRHDTIKNINCPHDWRTILWARFLLNATNIPDLIDGVTVTRGKLYKLSDGGIFGNDLILIATANVSSGFIMPIILRKVKTTYILHNNISGNLKITVNKSDFKEYLTLLPDKCENVYIGDSSTTYNSLLNNVLIMDNTTQVVKNIYLGDSCYNNTFTEYQADGQESYSSYGNINAGNNCNNNIFRDVHDLILEDNVNNNFFDVLNKSRLGYNTNENVFSIGSANIIIDGAVAWSFFDESTDINIIGNNHTINIMKSNNINIGSNCNTLTIFEGCINIDIGLGCPGNHIPANCHNLTISSGSMANKRLTAISDFINNQGSIIISKNVGGKPVYMKLDANNVPSYTVIP